MKMMTTALLVGGLALAGTAMGQQAEGQATGIGGASLKMGIDPKTRKLRPLTPAESAALESQGKARGQARAATARTAAQRATGFYLPETQAQAEAARLTRGGIDTMQPTADTMSDLQIVRNADGSLSYFEDGVPVNIDNVQPRNVEAARE